MKLKTMNVLPLAVVVLAAVVPALMGMGKQPEGQLVDSGSFGISVDGKRVATESFKITEGTDGSLSHSELRLEAESKPAQAYDMEMDASGNLRRYHWEKLLTDKATLLVEPNDSLLVEHIVDPQGKNHDVQHMLPTSTVILDDNFFSQRELLAWRFMASGCKPDSKGLRCELPKREYGTLNPSQHLSSDVFVEYLGQEKATIKGAPQNYTQIRITGEDGDWLMWLDEHEKVMKIVVPAAKTEVIRD